MPKKPKIKKEIVSDIQLVQDATRRRALIKDILFPYLVELNDTVGYSKVFLQAFSGLVEGVMEEQRKITTISHITPGLTKKLLSIFNQKDQEQKREYNRYMKLVDLLQDISVQDMSYATELPRYIDGFLMKDQNKKPISDIPIQDILG